MRPALAAGVLAVLAVVVSSGAAPFTASFVYVDAELKYRRDNDFSGTLDSAQKKRQAAVLKSLALLERPAEDFADDLKTAAGLAKVLKNAYPEEFSTPPMTLVVAFAPQTLDVVLDGALRNLEGDAFDGIVALAARIPSLTPKAAAVVQKAVDAFYGTIKRSYPTRIAWAKTLQKGWKLVLKGNRIADKGLGESMTFTLDGGSPFSATVHADVFTGDDGLQVSGTFLPMDGGLVTVYATLPGVTGPGSYPISGSGSTAAYVVYDTNFNEQDWILVGGTGTIVLDTFDVGGNNISGHFDFTAMGTTTLQIHADFTVTQSIDVNAGSLP